jgi:hypothetical protein
LSSLSVYVDVLEVFSLPSLLFFLSIVQPWSYLFAIQTLVVFAIGLHLVKVRLAEVFVYLVSKDHHLEPRKVNVYPLLIVFRFGLAVGAVTVNAQVIGIRENFFFFFG